MSNQLQHRFVEGFPDELEQGILYIALDYATMSHLCCCGCGQEVVTPLSPKDWKIIFDGETVSVSPSIGSWSLPCRSHYVIRNGNVQWAGDWSDDQIQRGRQRDLIGKRGKAHTEGVSGGATSLHTQAKPPSLWSRIKLFFGGKRT